MANDSASEQIKQPVFSTRDFGVEGVAALGSLKLESLHRLFIVQSPPCCISVARKKKEYSLEPMRAGLNNPVSYGKYEQ